MLSQFDSKETGHDYRLFIVKPDRLLAKKVCNVDGVRRPLIRTSVIRRVAQYRPHARWLLHGREATPALGENLGFKVGRIGSPKKASPFGLCFTAGLS